MWIFRQGEIEDFIEDAPAERGGYSSCHRQPAWLEKQESDWIFPREFRTTAKVKIK
jgi:hypothetical protein